ncbi:MAG: M20/M25/M40 family metallo-hydrolase [Gemmatimonadota bacterium]
MAHLRPYATRWLVALASAASLAALASPARAQSPYRVAAPAPAGFDREVAQREATARLEALIRIDTQNPPGNEALVAAWFDSLFRGVEGFETHVLDVGEGRANVVARLRSPNPTAKPLLVMGHMDVVGADTTKWTTPPFEPTTREGYLYGRGAIDDKGMLAAAATALLRLAERRDELRRDVVFLGTAAEEGGPNLGIDWVLENRRDLIGDAEFALNEGGRIRLEDGRVRTVSIQTTEKVPYDVRLTARGTGGHGSVPLPQNPLAALARAAARIHEWRAPVRLNETTRLYFERLATIEDEPAAKRAMETVARSADSAAARAAADVLAREPLHNTVLRSAASLTILEGGFRNNVIPSEGTANFNLRVLPGDDVTTLVHAIEQAGAEEGVPYELSREPQPPVPPSPVGSDLFRAMERTAEAMAPGVVVMPYMSAGGTDGAALRAAGIPTYGILPMPLPMEDELRMHGDDERVPLEALGWATEYLYRVLGDVAAGGGR